jgi:hypothetical protein
VFTSDPYTGEKVYGLGSMKADDFVSLHTKLFSTKSKGEPVPSEFNITPRILKLYKGFQSGARGFSNRELDPELFLATFVAAIRQVCLPSETRPDVPKFSRVVFAVARPANPWALERIEHLVRHIFRQRRGDAAGVHYIRETFHRLVMGSRILQLPKPERWVAFGYSNDDPLPEWVQGSLIDP